MNASELLQQIIGPAGALVILAVLTYFSMVQLMKERSSRIVLLEQQSQQCSADRLELHKTMNVLQTEVRELYKTSMLDLARKTAETVLAEARVHAADLLHTAEIKAHDKLN